MIYLPGAKWLFEAISFLITRYLPQIDQIFKNDESTWMGNFINFPIKLVTIESTWLILMIRSSNFEPKTRWRFHCLRENNNFSAFTSYTQFENFLGQSLNTKVPISSLQTLESRGHSVYALGLRRKRQWTSEILNFFCVDVYWINLNHLAPEDYTFWSGTGSSGSGSYIVNEKQMVIMAAIFSI